MAKKARQRISYVLELDHSSSGGHRLGVNGLAVDPSNAILYSGGRDGVVCAWDLNLDLKSHSNPSKPTTKFRASTQAHTHWVNDITLAASNSALVSASSDLTVKVWRPSTGLNQAHTIGQHADYVKCLAAPAVGDWVASGGLDRKIQLWDINGNGKNLEIDVSGEEVTEKGSVYAMGVGGNILASGGPESIVRLWDPRTGDNITKFVGHTDNVRSILVNESGDTVLTASSDQTVKVWSVTAGRCMYTLTMHNDSVWSLFSEDPSLGIFYSSDRSGMVVKTDTRGTVEMDEGLSVAVAQEHDGVSKVVASGDYLWTASSSSSINRWTNIDTGPDAQLPEPFRQLRPDFTQPSIGEVFATGAAPVHKEIPAKSILRMSHTAPFPLQHPDSPEPNTASVPWKASELIGELAQIAIEPIHHLPEETIEGQNGLVKHKLLNDRRRVLTLDNAGDVLLWDLIKCKVIQRFGKKHLEDVEPEVNTLEAVAPWCSIDTSSGNLTVILELFNCFDAEIYVDELELEDPIEFREDQRINLGRWILRYLFANLIDEEIKRDETHRIRLNDLVEKRKAAALLERPLSTSLPNPQGWDTPGSPASTPKANGNNLPLTPGLGIGVATPAVNPHLPGVPENALSPNSPIGKRSSQISRPSGDDYFSGASNTDASSKTAGTPSTERPPTAKEEGAKPPAEEKGNENGKPSFSKKLRMGMSFGSKKGGRSASTTAAEKPTVVDEKPEENKSESSSNHEKEVDDNLRGVIQKIHNDYEKQLLENPDKPIETKITPSLPIDTPVLKLPSGTRIIIQEETSGGIADLYRGAVETVGLDSDVIEEKAPMWLGELLLMNSIPPKDPVKVSFVLHPWQDTLPSLATTDGNNRLNANRMLRVRKIMAYVAERIDPTWDDPNSLKPEEYLELYCNDQPLSHTLSLATLRAHIWKGGNDVILYYKANGRKEIKEFPKPAAEESRSAETEEPGPSVVPGVAQAAAAVAV